MNCSKKKNENLYHDQLQRAKFSQRDALISRANSLKKAVRQIIEHAEKALDEQNEQNERNERSEQQQQQRPATSGADAAAIINQMSCTDIKLIVTSSDDPVKDLHAASGSRSNPTWVRCYQRRSIAGESQKTKTLHVVFAF